MFARALGATNPIYDVTRTHPDDVIAPPTFVQASAHYDPDYPLRPKPGEPWRGSGPGAYNPWDTDERYATEVAGYPSVFGHGMLTMGATATVLTDWFGDESLVRYGVRFLKQVWPGDTLVARATVVDVRPEDGAEVAEVEIVT